MKADGNKIMTMMNWPLPKTLRELLRSFGPDKILQEVLKGYDEIAAPLT